MAQLPLNELLAVFLDATRPEKLSTDEAMSVLASALVARGQIAGLSLNEMVAGVADTYRKAVSRAREELRGLVVRKRFAVRARRSLG